nr:VCBS domain-containing protein [uncultured Cohaesibacter sp.]
MIKKANLSAPQSLSGIRRSAPSPLALEQRFMFDGAAIDHAIDTVTDGFFDGTAGDNGDVSAPDLLQLDFADDGLQVIASESQTLVRTYLAEASDEALFALFGGDQDAPDTEWSERLNSLRAAFADGSFTIDIVEMDRASLFTAIAAYASEGPDDSPTIFINSGWLDMFDSEEVTRVLVEEVGHAIDDYLNPDADTAGDEGEAFAAALLGTDAREGFAIGVETGQAFVDGVAYDVEFASFKFVNAYQMITDVDGDGIIDNTENWAEKEQETHTLMVGDTAVNYGGLNASDPITVTNASNSEQFSANDISVIGINIGGQDYYGWISRPLKVQGQVVGFYFWTDQDFTDLSSAQVDGNQDNDTADLPSDPGYTDNKGFVLVVDQSYFTGLINAGMTSLTVAASPVWSAVAAGTYNTIEVKSSSDRVDSAMNALLGSATKPAALVANDDLASGSPGTSGGAALEEGGDDNSPSLNSQTANNNLTDTINATGNVLTNDTNSEGNSALGVIGVSSASTNESAGITSASAGVINGRYGTLTLNADGSYSYVIDNSDPAVQALLSTSTPLQDAFTYTINDGIGGMDSATLTIEIKGSNDAPVATDDTNVARESLLTDGSAYTGSDTVGMVATGDVTLNDSDVDHNEVQKTIVGIDETGSATAATYTSSGSSTTLTFITSTNINSVSVGANVFWDHDNNGSSKPVALAVSDGAPSPTYTFLTITTKLDGATSGTTDFTLSATPTHYWDGASWVAFTDVETQLASGSSYFEFGAANGNVAANSAKGGTLDTRGVDVVVSVDITGAAGSIYEGMVVTALDGATSVLPSGTVVTGVNYDGSGAITSIELSNDFSPKPSDPTGYSLSFTMPTGGDTTITTAYGTLLLLSDGSYSYTPIVNNALLDAGETVVETFDYIMQDALGAKSSSTLTITVLGSGANDPVASNDAIAASEAGGIANGTAGLDPSASVSPNRLIDNDTTDTGNFPNKYVFGVTSVETGNNGVPASSSVASSSSSSPAVIVGRYGTFTVGADGSYVYEVDNSNATVEAMRTSGETLVETFSYLIKNYDAGNTTVGGLDTALVTITISGANDTPVAQNDAMTLLANLGAQTGNVLNNDADVDAGDTKLVTFVKAGTTATPDGVVSGATPVTGSYGTLTINSDGTYSYLVDQNNATVQALAAGTTIAETFSYQMRDTDGAVSVATLTVTIEGVNDAPVNSYPASVTATIDTAFAFTGSDLVSVADVDSNLQSVVLHVDHGTLTATGSGGTITGSGTADLTISGTQTEINAILATLSYLPTSGYSGADYLTIFSQDDQSLSDSDGFAINIPTPFAGPTVKESDLSTGTNPSGTEEAASVTLTQPTGQTFGTVTQSGTDAYGTWTLTTGGVFTYTLTSAPGVTGGTSRAVTILTYDQYGNATSNPLTVTITDDSPAAVADTNSAQDGGLAISGNVLTDGVDDDFGADGPQPAGGVVGVRAAGGDTTSAVATGTGSSITGTYGSLTLNADGSYSYTPANNALSSSVTDVFVYTIEDTDGSRSTTTLTITVQAVTVPNDAPVNSYPASVTATIDTAFAFTGSNLVSVADVDSNLQSVVLHVDHGTLTATGSGGTITGSGTADLTISGTQTEINAILATLSYLPTSGYSGADYLTIFSQDDQSLSDSDGFAINIPTPFAGPTVKESDLSTGTNPSGTEEAASVTLTQPTGQTFGTVTQSGTDAYGTWTLTTGGVFTYTLTSAPGVTGGTSRAVTILTYDQYGNATSNPLTVTITDDSPAAVADTNSAQDGGLAISGNVLTDGVDDDFGADGPQPAGGVVGVRAAGGDTTSAVATGTGSSITGTYGSLTLNADGSYSYTPANNALSSSVTDVFVYTIEDTDGSRSTTTLTITVQAAPALSADLSIAKSVDHATPALNSEIIYTLVVSNAGPDTASNVRVSDELPAGLLFIGASLDGVNWDSDGSVSNYVVNPSGTDLWSVGNLANGASKTLYIKAEVAGRDVILNTASVTSDTIDPDSSNNIDGGGDGNQTVDAYGPITVTGGTYNENSGLAIFTVTADPNQLLTFDVRDVADSGKAPTGDNEGGNGDALDTAPLYYSLDGGATWQLYQGTAVQARSVPILVAVDITAERDDVYEGEEQVQLVVNPGHQGEASGFSSIFDNGTGIVSDPIDETTTSNTGGHNGTPRDDDRPVPPTPGPAPQPAPAPPVPQPPADPAPNPVTPPESQTSLPSIFETSRPGSGLGEGRTSSIGFPIIVIDSGQSNLSIYRGVADQYADTGSQSSFAVPFDAFAHSDPNERISLTAKLSDGRNLPTWVTFDAQSGKFTANPPEGFSGELKIKVTARDSQGREVSTLFRFNVGEKRNGVTGGRASLSDQLRQAGERPIPGFLAHLENEPARPAAKSASLSAPAVSEG